MSAEDGIARFQQQAVALSQAIRARLGEDFFDGDGEARVALLTLPPPFGEVVAFKIDGFLYALDPGSGELLAIREHAGRVEWLSIAEDGTCGPWQRQAPPPAQAAMN